MNVEKRVRIAVILLLFASALFSSCNGLPPIRSINFRSIRLPVLQAEKAAPTEAFAQTPVAETMPTLFSTFAPLNPQAAGSGEPAGCLSAEAEQAVISVSESLAQADQVLGLSAPLSERIMPDSWNAYTHSNFPNHGSVLSLDVNNVKNKYWIQRMMNALHVAGFITWLRQSPRQGLHILAIPLRGVDPATSEWSPYIQAYWENSQSLPDDPYVIATLKLPPCRWMVEQGYAPREAVDWWAADTPGRPDYAGAASTYLADTEKAASQVARRIGWLGDGTEGPNTMCGPLVWSILNDAGALPLDWGGWSEGPIAFWLAKPRTNGRPWSLFPSESYHVYSFNEPLGRFDFRQFPLYPGDFMYTYSQKDGFDHMLVVTEVDGQGNVYTVTNLPQAAGEKKMTITVERLLLLNLNDPSAGIARNQWATDQRSGRTGHAGFDVFRWAWMEKDIQGQPAAYAVQPGDTLRLIALRWHTPVDQIARYNGINVDADLSIGQALQIPPNEMAGVLQ